MCTMSTPVFIAGREQPPPQRRDTGCRLTWKGGKEEGEREGGNGTPGPGGGGKRGEGTPLTLPTLGRPIQAREGGDGTALPEATEGCPLLFLLQFGDLPIQAPAP